jgi:hypothetical protein
MMGTFPPYPGYVAAFAALEILRAVVYGGMDTALPSDVLRGARRRMVWWTVAGGLLLVLALHLLTPASALLGAERAGTRIRLGPRRGLLRESRVGEAPRRSHHHVGLLRQPMGGGPARLAPSRGVVDHACAYCGCSCLACREPRQIGPHLAPTCEAFGGEVGV